jgi:two-component system CheB/CheR fusion protein
MHRKQNGNRRHAGAPPQRARAASRAAPAALGVARERGDLIPPLIVGLGASAGGLDAFKAFLTHMPPRSGMAFVLVQHLDPHHKSLLVELISKSTEIPVQNKEKGMQLTADHV